MAFSFNATTQEVLEQIVREPRFRELTKLPLFAPMEIGLGLSAFALFALSTWLYVSDKVPFLVMLALNSFAVYASFTPLHDATHRTVSRNRRVNDAIGTICCLLLIPGITTRIYRYLHLEHHRYTGHPSKDPDEPFVSSSPLAIPFVLAGLDVLWSSWYVRQWQSRPVGERIEFCACIMFYIGLHLVFLLSPYAWEFFLCFMIPQRFGLFYVAWFFAHIQHPKGVEWEKAPFQTTVRVKTNAIARWMLLGQSKHCIHHLAPSLPYYRYHHAWNLGQHLFERQGIPTRTLWSGSKDLRLANPHVSSNEDGRWLNATVDSVLTVGEGIRAYDFVPADNDAWPAFSAGSHIDVEMTPQLVRQYSLCNDPSDEQRYRIAVKYEEQGNGGSRFMHQEVRPGSQLKIGKPRNNFPLGDDFEHYVLIAGGIGVTPLLAMAYALHEAGKSFELHICARNKQSLAFREELGELPFEQSITSYWDDSEHQHRFSASIVLAAKHHNSGLYVCGPSGFMSHVLNTAKAHAWPEASLFSETFVPPKVDTSNNKAFEVKIASSGEILQIAASEKLIDVLHENGYVVMCSCTQGICGSCITPVLEGVPDHRDAIMTDEDRASNRLMTVCVSRAKSERLLLDL